MKAKLIITALAVLVCGIYGYKAVATVQGAIAQCQQATEGAMRYAMEDRAGRPWNQR